MHVSTARALTQPEGLRACERAAEFIDPDALSTAEAMRAEFDPELAAAALTQISLRRRARAKLAERADQLLWTPDAVEQATRAEVSAWRAQRLKDAGITHVIDLGCGAGADSLAFLDAGLQVTAVEIDPATAHLATHNLPGARVICGDATELAPELLANAGPDTAVYADPARRTARGRSWHVEDLTPPWHFVLSLLAGEHSCCIKLGPGIPTQILPSSAQAVWVSHRGDVVECGLWKLPEGHSSGGVVSTEIDADRGEPGSDNEPHDPSEAPFDRLRDELYALDHSRAAILLPQQIWAYHDPHAPQLPVRPAGKYLYEPDGAVLRAGAITQISGQSPIWRIAPQVAYLSSNRIVHTPLATAFKILDVMDTRVATLRAWVKQQKIGRLEIKKRAIEVDPAELRRRLKPKGPHAATLILSPTEHGARAFWVERIKQRG